MDLFKSLDNTILEQLATNCRKFSLEPEETLFRENTFETAMYLTLSVDLLVFKGVKQIAMLSTGKYVGEISLIESKPRPHQLKQFRSAYY
jgi:CRP-like cAMP-binding protein|tara:strand:- start:168 stop:437 length:270 start_codon:yes stop_codon:yes gene_type:complete